MVVLGRFFVVYCLVCGSGIPFVGCYCMNVDVMDSCMHFEVKKYIPVVFKLLVWCGAEGYVSGLQDAGLLALFCGVYGVGD